MKGICALCLRTEELKLSHIIPKFVFRNLKETSPTAIRSNQNPNLRIQDGEKISLLCDDCEHKLGAWEKMFCERLYLPLHDPQPVVEPIYYDEWAVKFAVSVSWRVLKYFELENPQTFTTDFTVVEQKYIVQAAETWRKFLVEESKHPASFTQHMLPLDVVSDHQGPNFSPFLNRFFLRAVGMGILRSDNTLYTCTKLCRLVIFGRIRDKHPHYWKGLQLHRRGDIRPRKYIMPSVVFEYLNNSADKAHNMVLSPKQQEIIQTEVEKKLEVIANSEIFRAMQADVYFSGEEAFKKSS